MKTYRRIGGNPDEFQQIDSLSNRPRFVNDNNPRRICGKIQAHFLMDATMNL
ncbi:hypothetical protein IH992_00685 [Candidatus Poribacteria bacterium]|nr:hypothetical protein [Candidatus Poribacteria bacterium]